MYRTVFFVFCLFLFIPPLQAAPLGAESEGFVLAQSGPDIELPSLPELPSITMPETQEETKSGDSPSPSSPPMPPVPAVHGTTKTDTAPAPASEMPVTIPLPPVSPVETPAKAKMVPPAVSPNTQEPSPSKTQAMVEEQKEPLPEETLMAAPPMPPLTPVQAEEGEEEQTTNVAPKEIVPVNALSVAAKIEKCKPLSKNIENCVAFTCSIEDFDSNFPGLTKTWNITPGGAGTCLYNESMPGKATLQCKLSEKSRKAYASYYDALLLHQTLLSDANLLKIYGDSRQNECLLVNEEGDTLDPALYNVVSNLSENVEDYGASDAPKGDCETLDEKLKTCEAFYCKGNDPVQEKFFNRKVSVERKIIGWSGDSCMYIQKVAEKNLEGCKFTKTDSTSASQCSVANLAEIAKTAGFLSKMTLAEKAASGDATLKSPEVKKQSGDIYKPDNTALMALAEKNYKTQMLPYIIHRKQYDKTNKDLPLAYYPREFKEMTFAALDRNDIESLRAFIAKIQEIDKSVKKRNKPPLGGIEMRDNNGNTLLIRSVLAGNFRAAQMLIGSGADIEAKNNSGVTPLQVAAYGGRADLVTLLLGVGARRDVADKYGRTALSHAIEKNYDTIATLLLSGRDKASASSNSSPFITAVKLGNSNASVSLLNKGTNVDTRDDQQRTALMIAAENGDVVLVNILLKRGANIFLQDKFGQTAEVLAANAGHADVARILAAAALNKRLH